MDFPAPSTVRYTVYSKSGCPNCNRVKDLLKQKSLDFDQHNCDEYLLESKEEFLAFIAASAGKECRVFPMVFDSTGAFVGSYTETKARLDRQLEFNETF